MKEICPINECTGCGACSGVCPVSCITMQGDEFGYIHPVINNDICINCSRCKKVCPNNNQLVFINPTKCYASWNTDLKSRESSTSGGVAAALSKVFIENGGVAYGAVGHGCGDVEHMRAGTVAESLQFKKSKYVQSFISAALYKQIQENLKSGIPVLFFGTPCQIAGVRSYVGNTDLLTCVEIVCHGVPSKKLLKDHIRMVLGKNANSVTDFSTRDSEGYFLSLADHQRIIYKKAFPQDEYLNAFQYGLFYRPSCYQCHYAKPERQSDLTIGDFWGLGETAYPHRKVSLILVNTSKGRDLLKSTSSNLFLDERQVDEAVKGNSQLQHPSIHHEFYGLFRRLYPKYGYMIAVKICLAKFYLKNSLFKLAMSFSAYRKYYNNKK